MLEARQRQDVLGLPPVVVAAGAHDGACPRCGEATVAEKTVSRRMVTLAHGAVCVREAVRVCRQGCRHGDDTLVRQRSELVARYVPPGGVFGYDVIVRVGLARYLEHRQREEIRHDLRTGYGITVCVSEVSMLARRFLDHLEALHRSRAPALAQALRMDGGWPLHVDATGEDGRGTLLVLFAGWRRWVLGSFKIPTERADQILPCLREVAGRFASPCAVMRDLGRAMIPAVESFVKERRLDIPVLSCHQHFLADLGTDLLDESHDALRRILRATRARPLLRALARELGRELGSDVVDVREEVLAWQAGQSSAREIPSGRAGLGVIRSLAQWVLDFQADGRYHTFPFDRPWLDLYDRCTQMSRAVDAFLRGPTPDKRVRRTLRRLARTLDRLASREDTARVVASLRMRAALFDELRKVLRLEPRRAEHRQRPQPSLRPAEAAAELRDIRSGLTNWKRSLRSRRPARGPAQDKREAIDLILDHLARHGSSLFGHRIRLPARAGGGFRLVERTNNLEENFFRDLKHGERRRSGRKILTQDLEQLPPTAALVPNLLKPDYVSILCGSLDKLPAAFAALDAQDQDLKRRKTPATVKDPRTARPAVESASLPAADRCIVRSDAMAQRILAAASSRAPHTAKKTG